MKKILNLILMLIISTSVYASNAVYESPMTLYKDNYFIAGNQDDQVKFQISAKYNIFFPSNTGLFFAYSQISFWDLYKQSAPFKENNYNPEIYYHFQSGNNIFNNFVIPGIDYIQVSPIEHLSNGRDGAESRGINTYYAQVQTSYGERYNVGVNLKVFNYYNQSNKNADIEDYKSYYEVDLFFKIRSGTISFLDKEELHLKFGGYDKSDYNDYKLSKDKKDIKGWMIGELQFRIFTSKVQPKIFIQYYKGYGESLISYNKDDTALRCGITF